MSDGLAELSERVRRDLSLLDYPRREWLVAKTSARGESIYDVLIVGAGQGGLAVAFGLMRERITNLLVVDENPEGLAGPWLRFARMRTLRTPKYLTGPDLGIPSLTPARLVRGAARPRQLGVARAPAPQTGIWI